MWYGPNLQRSYKYMSFASKMPSLRIDQSELKCKNGCDYFGNPQWQGYCSKCHREQMMRQRRAEKASTNPSATLPKPEQKKPDRGLKLSSHSSFSKFEEKRLRQTETLKKANLLKFSVFKKSSSDDHEHTPEKRLPEFKIPSMVNEGMKQDFRVRFPALGTQVERDARAFAHNFIMDVIKCANVMSVDELSERVQRQYQRFIKHMDTAPHFANVDSDTKELLVDFVEKHAMTYLHELPSVVFSPAGTDDERLDRAMSERIQQLGWVGERHLECKLDRGSATCRQLLYKAISELLGMDAASSPGGKLARVRRCCRHVLALCGAPASADDLLPALIFTVLKANPPRLVSNINFVTRFCNAQRLMTGEGGYYFTNLCCAVSFIENLTAESLSMDKTEFDCYMAMPASIGGSAWAAALSLCGAAREAEELRLAAQELSAAATTLRDNADQMHHNAVTFEEQIVKKVQDVLSKTPLEIKPRRELPQIGKFKTSAKPLIDIEPSPPSKENTSTSAQPDTQTPDPQSLIDKLITIEQTEMAKPTVDRSVPIPLPAPPLRTEIEQKEPEILTVDVSSTEPEKLNILGFEVIERPSPKSPQNLDQTWDLKQISSLELLTPSPLGFTPFDSRSIDELMTPDEFGSDHLAPGLSNINYDIDLSDFSGDNSIAEDAPKEAKDPFSPDGIKPFDPFAPQPSTFSETLEKFNEFSLVDTKTNRTYDPFEIVQRNSDPFNAALAVTLPQQGDPISSPQNEGTSILDNSDSPTAACLLPSPLLPQSSGKPT
ncbi:rab5 GDP/GTP exchange factor isoform X1 [Ostrinia furnacalis]|uniref:rab5 GDP/GTP exchange factor isoform X1 n=2 Tax=Ostrinia furnacalis TaxID=93504 RepID=UPI00103E8A3E|nr:rab5 GDP/GTP exchange factor isoform X1 [Ostrinia furnacalis]